MILAAEAVAGKGARASRPLCAPRRVLAWFIHEDRSEDLSADRQARRPHQYKAHADFALMAYWNTVMCEIGMERSSDAVLRVCSRLLMNNPG